MTVMSLPTPGFPRAGGIRADEMVVLVHGLASSRILLRKLERRLQHGGFRTRNWGYPSVRGEIAGLGAALGDELRQLQDDHPNVSRMHLVTHSMGGILARTALTTGAFPRLSRVVMLAPPHGGSRVARTLARGLGWICQPLEQLSDQADSFVNRLPQPEGYEIGIIAAARDRVVRLEDTRLSAQVDHAVVNSGHTSMLFHDEVSKLVIRFLRRGRFGREAIPAPPANAVGCHLA